jgi:hypothetical protein
MTTYNTGNPIGSTDARDLYDNAQAFDQAINSSAATYTDRFGVAHKPLAKAMQDIEIAGTTYATQTAGLAGTTSGQFFTVPASTAVDSLILYKNQGGAAVEVKRYPSTLAVSELTEAVNGSMASINQAVTDSEAHAASAATVASNASASAATAALHKAAAQDAATLAQTYASQAQATNPDSPIRLNPRKVTANFTVPADYNASSVGPIAVSEGITVTVADRATWSIT